MCVHTRHCCTYHGCKYDEKDCPVVTGTAVMDDPNKMCTLCYEEEFMYLDSREGVDSEEDD